MWNDSDDTHSQESYTGNIWGRKWSIVSLIIILLFIGIATCRYLVIKPDHLIIPEDVEQFD